MSEIEESNGAQDALAAIAGPSEDVAAPDLAAAPDWKARLWDWLEVGGKRAGIPALIISLAALYFVIANYRLTVAANRPYLVSYGLRVDFDPRSTRAELGFNNVGKVTARRGSLTLFSLAHVHTKIGLIHDTVRQIKPESSSLLTICPAQTGEVPEKLTSVPIVGAGTNIFPGAESSATSDPHLTDGVAFVLACAAYFDDAGTRYEQAFLFERGQLTARDPVQLAYMEVAAPDLSRCNSPQAR